MKWKWKWLSRVRLFSTPWTKQFLKFSRLEYWSGQTFPSLGDLPNPGIKPRSLPLQVGSLPSESQEKSSFVTNTTNFSFYLFNAEYVSIAKITQTLEQIPTTLIRVTSARTACLCSAMSDSFTTPWTVAARLLCPWDFPGKNTGVGCHFLLQGIFPTQGSSQSLLHWQADSLPLSHQGALHRVSTSIKQMEILSHKIKNSDSKLCVLHTLCVVCMEMCFSCPEKQCYL